MVAYRKLLSILIAQTTVGVVGFHYAMYGKPTHEYWWTDYGLLIFSTYMFIAFILGWTIYLSGTSYFPEHR